MAFDPDKYLAKKVESATPKASGFDPDAYLSSRAESKSPMPGEGYLRGAIDALPFAGGIAGGVAGSVFATPGLGTAAGAGLGAAGGKALENFLEAQLFNDPKTVKQLYTDPVVEGAWGAAGEGLGQAAAAGLQTVGKGIGKVYQGAKGLLENTPGLGGITKAVTGRFKEMPKPNIEAIQDSASRLNIKPTQGMLTNNSLRQGMESSLSQSPTAAGRVVNEEYNQVFKGLKEGADTVLKGGQENIDLVTAGQGARGGIVSTLENRAAPAIKIYDQLAGDAKLIAVDPKITARVAKNIRGLDYAQILGSEDAGIAENMAKNLENTKDLASLRRLKSYLGAQLNTAQGSTRHTIGEIYDKLVKMEKSTIMRETVKASQNLKEGDEIAKAMISDLKKANAIYKGVSQDAKLLAQEMGVGKVRNYSDFTTKLKVMPDEKLAEKFWQAKNARGMTFFQQNFPEAFEYVRKAKMADLYTKSVTKGEVSLPKLLNNAERMTPQARKMLLGPDADGVIKDLKTVYNSMPAKMGPSGTPQGQEFRDFEVLSPSAWFNEARRGLQLWILRNPEKASKFKIQGLIPPTVKALPVKRIAIGQGLLGPAARGLVGPKEGSNE